MSAPDVAVVVSSHDRVVRLRWLLNALEEQTLPRDRWEVIVAHDSGDEYDAMLSAHPLAGDGTLRHLRFEPRPGPAVKRNAAWRTARAPLVVFTDDDCRPPPDWLAEVVAAAAAHPGAVVQGPTRPDPDEEHLLAAPHVHTLTVEPPTAWGQTSNIAYSVDVLERLDGFYERFTSPAAEDTDLLQRALAAGIEQVAAPGALTYHAVEAMGLPQAVRIRWRWRWQAALIKRHPHLRDPMPLRIFWKPRHAWMALALAGLAVAGRRRPWLAALLAVPWARAAAPSYGNDPRGLVRTAAELPGAAAIDLAEMTAVARGAIEERTLLL